MFDYTQPQAADALEIAQRLQAADFTAYFAGGCVRDALLGRAPKDFDVATDATPEKVRELFGKRRTLAFGVSFGVIGVLGNSNAPTEVATFRSDGQYSDGRRPDSVRFGNAQDDAMRRDFTINGMFFDPVGGQVIDYVGGQEDLSDARIRAIGNAAQRISEDKLRMLRAVRFAASLGFEIEPATMTAIQHHADTIHAVSGERIGAEMRRMLSPVGRIGESKQAVSLRTGYAWRLWIQSRLLSPLWPLMAHAIERDPAIVERGTSLLSSIEPPSLVVALACLIIEAELDSDACIQQLTERWKLSCDEQRAIAACAKQHSVVQHASQLPWSTVQPVLIGRDAEAVVSTARALSMVHGRTVEGIERCQAKLKGPHEQLDPQPLMTGDRLKELGYRPGPLFRDLLLTIRQEQLDGKLASEAQAIARVSELLQTSRDERIGVAVKVPNLLRTTVNCYSVGKDGFARSDREVSRCSMSCEFAS